MNFLPDIENLIYDPYTLEDLQNHLHQFKTASEIKIYTENIDKFKKIQEQNVKKSKDKK